MRGRNFTRVDYSVGASIRYDNNVAMCNIDNLSIHGMFLKTKYDIPLDTPVNVTVFHSIQLPINISARVVRKEASGVGLEINNLNVKSFVQLRDIVSKNSLTPDKVMQETYKMLKSIQ
jgi:hypothetical protein